MPRRICIIQGHPGPDDRGLCRDLADIYARAAWKAGHAVAWIDLAELGVLLPRTQADPVRGAMGASVRAARQEVLAAGHIVLVAPLGAMPAVVEMILERVVRPGVASTDRTEDLAGPLLAGRSARIIAVTDLPALALRRRWRPLRRARRTLRSAGVGPIHETLFGRAGAVGEASRRKWLARTDELGREGA